MKRILIVEDEAHMADFLTECLSAAGYEIAIAADGFEALEQMYTTRPALVLVDIMMPGMGGWELVRRIRAADELRHTPIVICTARKEDTPPPGLVQGILHKPFRIESAREIVAACIS